MSAPGDFVNVFLIETNIDPNKLFIAVALNQAVSFCVFFELTIFFPPADKLLILHVKGQV